MGDQSVVMYGDYPHVAAALASPSPTVSWTHFDARHLRVLAANSCRLRDEDVVRVSLVRHSTANRREAVWAEVVDRHWIPAEAGRARRRPCEQPGPTPRAADEHDRSPRHRTCPAGGAPGSR